MKSIHDNLFYFILLTFVWTWSLGFVPLFFGFKDTLFGDLMFKLLAGPAPSAVALFFVFFTYSKEQKRDYFGRTFSIRQMGITYPLLIMIFFAIVCAVTIFVSTVFLGADIPQFGGVRTLAKQPYMIFVYLFFAVMSGPINEEFGWRGFALDRLIVRYGFWKASVILGFVWGIWHLPWYFYPGNGQYIAWHISPVHGVAYIISTITLSCIVSIVYLRTNRSIMAGAFVHMISNFFTGSILIYPFDAMYIVTLFYVSIILELLVIIYFYTNKNFKNEINSKYNKLPVFVPAAPPR